MNRILSMKRRFRDQIQVPKGVCQFAVMIFSFIIKPYSFRGGRDAGAESARADFERGFKTAEQFGIASPRLSHLTIQWQPHFDRRSVSEFWIFIFSVKNDNFLGVIITFFSTILVFWY